MDGLSPGWMGVVQTGLVAFFIWLARWGGNKKIDKSDEKTKAVVETESSRQLAKLAALEAQYEALAKVALKSGDLLVNQSIKFTETNAAVQAEIAGIKSALRKAETSLEVEPENVGAVKVLETEPLPIGKVIVKP